MVNKDLKATMKVDGSNFDLTDFTVGDVDTDKMADKIMEDLGMREKNYIKAGGHKLKEDDDSVYCKDCDVEYEIPRLLQESSDFNEVVYRLYVMGKFKEEHSCSSFPEKTEHKVHPDRGQPLTGSGKPFNHSSPPDIKTSGTAFMGPDGDKYRISGGDIANLDTGHILSTTEKTELLGELNQKL